MREEKDATQGEEGSEMPAGGSRCPGARRTTRSRRGCSRRGKAAAHLTLRWILPAAVLLGVAAPALGQQKQGVAQQQGAAGIAGSDVWRGGEGNRDRRQLPGVVETIASCGDCTWLVRDGSTEIQRTTGASGTACKGCTELYLQGGGSKPVARSINQDAVSGMTQLVQLHINDWLSITALPRTLFRNLPKLQQLNMRRNGIASLDMFQFGTVNSTGHDVVCCPVLELLALGENKLNTAGAIPAAGSYGLASNNSLISRASPFEFFTTQLLYLALDKNGIVSLDGGCLSTLSSLKSLFLNNNKLTTLPLTLLGAEIYGPKKLLGPRKISRLLLDNNLIETLPFDVFFHMTEVSVFTLNENKLKCQPRWDRFPASVEIGGAVDLKVEDLPACTLSGVGDYRTTPAPAVQTTSGSTLGSGTPLNYASLAAVLVSVIVCALHAHS